MEEVCIRAVSKLIFIKPEVGKKRCIRIKKVQIFLGFPINQSSLILFNCLYIGSRLEKQGLNNKIYLFIFKRGGVESTIDYLIYLCFFIYSTVYYLFKCKDADSRGAKPGPTKRFISLT